MNKYHETSLEGVIAGIHFLQDVVNSEFKNSETFFILWFAQQEEDIVLQLTLHVFN